ncbi:MAG: AI-2E family transporter [Chitinophagales bacterium]
MKDKIILPFYAKITTILFGLVVFTFILYVGRDILVPLIYATIFAILLNPLVNFLDSKGVNRILAIFISLLFGMLCAGLVMYFVSSQISRFSSEFPQLKEKFNIFFSEIIRWVSGTFNISKSTIDQWVTDTRTGIVENSQAVLGKTLLTLSGILVLVFLLPVYIFMILFYKTLVLQFIHKIFDRTHHDKVADVLMESKGLIQNYLIGLLIESAIVAALNSTALIILGIKYAILIGIISALLNIIPYIGGLISISLAMIMALITKSPSYVLFVFLAYIIIQFLDNNFLVPKIVASKVKINALVSIVVVLIGNAIWGIPGMFLSIPLTAIIKVIFDRIEPLKPWGFLLGDNMPAPGQMIFNFKRKQRKTAADKA